MRPPSPQSVAAELSRATALFQQRAFTAYAGFGPTAWRSTPHSEVQ